MGTTEQLTEGYSADSLSNSVAISASEMPLALARWITALAMLSASFPASFSVADSTVELASLESESD
jgi:hypothetical protein